MSPLYLHKERVLFHGGRHVVPPFFYSGPGRTNGSGEWVFGSSYWHLTGVKNSPIHCQWGVEQPYPDVGRSQRHRVWTGIKLSTPTKCSNTKYVLLTSHAKTKLWTDPHVGVLEKQYWGVREESPERAESPPASSNLRRAPQHRQHTAAHHFLDLKHKINGFDRKQCLVH